MVALALKVSDMMIPTFVFGNLTWIKRGGNVFNNNGFTTPTTRQIITIPFASTVPFFPSTMAMKPTANAWPLIFNPIYLLEVSCWDSPFVEGTTPHPYDGKRGFLPIVPYNIKLWFEANSLVTFPLPPWRQETGWNVLVANYLRNGSCGVGLNSLISLLLNSRPQSMDLHRLWCHAYPANNFGPRYPPQLITWHCPKNLLNLRKTRPKALLANIIPPPILLNEPGPTKNLWRPTVCAAIENPRDRSPQDVYVWIFVTLICLYTLFFGYWIRQSWTQGHIKWTTHANHGGMEW